jgi:hypothetical protein
VRDTVYGPDAQRPLIGRVKLPRLRVALSGWLPDAQPLTQRESPHRDHRRPELEQDWNRRPGTGGYGGVHRELLTRV